MKTKNKIGIFKENGMIVQYFKDGMIVSIMPNPLFEDMDKFNKLPEGHEFTNNMVNRNLSINIIEIVNDKT